LALLACLATAIAAKPSLDSIAPGKTPLGRLKAPIAKAKKAATKKAAKKPKVVTIEPDYKPTAAPKLTKAQKAAAKAAKAAAVAKAVADAKAKNAPKIEYAEPSYKPTATPAPKVTVAPTPKPTAAPTPKFFEPVYKPAPVVVKPKVDCNQTPKPTPAPAFKFLTAEIKPDVQPVKTVNATVVTQSPAEPRVEADVQVSLHQNASVPIGKAEKGVGRVEVGLKSPRSFSLIEADNAVADDLNNLLEETDDMVDDS